MSAAGACNVVAILGLMVAFLGGLAAADEREEHEPTELLLVEGSHVARFQLDVRLDGQPVQKAWDEFFKTLYAFLDQDENGRLDSREFALAPTPFTLRQALWGQFVPAGDRAGKLADADRNRDEAVDFEELAAYYRAQYLGGVTVAIGVSPSSAALNRALRRRLDRDDDGRIELAEIRDAEAILRSRDRDGDELLSPSEVLPGIAQPGAAGTILLAPLGAAQAEQGTHSLLLLPPLALEISWAGDLLDRLDDDGNKQLTRGELAIPPESWSRLDVNRDEQLDRGELKAWRSLPLSERWRANYVAAKPTGLMKDDASVQSLRIESGRCTLTLRQREGGLASAYAATAKQYRANFSEADQNRDDSVEPTEIAAKASLGLLQRVARISDRNRDGTLNRAELEGWLDLQEKLSRSHVLLTVVDHGPGLFESIDSNQDGRLSQSELRTAAELLKKANCWSEGDKVLLDVVPRQLLATVSIGLPLDTAQADHLAPVKWFSDMDRNSDGNLSRAEFLGSSAQFDAFDQNRDQLITIQEAAIP